MMPLTRLRQMRDRLRRLSASAGATGYSYVQYTDDAVHEWSRPSGINRIRVTVQGAGGDGGAGDPGGTNYSGGGGGGGAILQFTLDLTTVGSGAVYRLYGSAGNSSAFEVETGGASYYLTAFDGEMGSEQGSSSGLGGVAQYDAGYFDPLIISSASNNGLDGEVGSSGNPNIGGVPGGYGGDAGWAGESYGAVTPGGTPTGFEGIGGGAGDDNNGWNGQQGNAPGAGGGGGGLRTSFSCSGGFGQFRILRIEWGEGI
jgi:hypothetical protein